MTESKSFNRAATIILTVIVIVTLLPIVLLVIASFTKEQVLIQNGYTFFPKALRLDAYYYMVKQGVVTGLCYWNDWTNGLYYVDNEKLFSIQLLLMKIMNNIQALKANSALMGTGTVELPGTSVRMAMAFVGILPILIVYLFVQKYLVEGVVIGAVKG